MRGFWGARERASERARERESERAREVDDNAIDPFVRVSEGVSEGAYFSVREGELES